MSKSRTKSSLVHPFRSSSSGSTVASPRETCLPDDDGTQHCVHFHVRRVHRVVAGPPCVASSSSSTAQTPYIGLLRVIRHTPLWGLTLPAHRMAIWAQLQVQLTVSTRRRISLRVSFPSHRIDIFAFEAALTAEAVGSTVDGARVGAGLQGNQSFRHDARSVTK